MVFGGLFTAIQSFKDRDTLPEHKPLCDLVLLVMEGWATQWGRDKAMKSLFNGNAIYHEIDEYIVPLFNLLSYMEAFGKQASAERIALLDVASGKGYLSLLISSLSVHISALRNIESITMVDKNKSMNLKHLDRIKEDGQAQHSPIPILFVQMDLHQRGIEQLVSGLTCTPVAIAIHPCKRLSSRCVELFNKLQIAALFLAPCCVPNPSKQPVKCGQQVIIPTVLHASKSPYDAWVEFLARAIDCECDKKEIVRIRERSLLVDGEVGEVWTKHVGNLCVVAIRTKAGQTAGSVRKSVGEAHQFQASAAIANAAASIGLGDASEMEAHAQGGERKKQRRGTRRK
jgi:hypothetical protein